MFLNKNTVGEKLNFNEHRPSIIVMILSAIRNPILRPLLSEETSSSM